MTELDRGRVAALAGFLFPVSLLALTIFAFLNDRGPVGWLGGEYAYAFVGIAFGSALAGLVVRATAPAPWRSLGSGMAWAGGAGVLVVVVLIVIFIWAIANWNPY